MRISNQSSLQTKRNVSSLQGRIAEHQTNIATGKRVRTMSDDPSAAAQAYKFNRQLRHLNQYSRNLDDANLGSISPTRCRKPLTTVSFGHGT